MHCPIHGVGWHWNGTATNLENRLEMTHVRMALNQVYILFLVYSYIQPMTALSWPPFMMRFSGGLLLGHQADRPIAFLLTHNTAWFVQNGVRNGEWPIRQTDWRYSIAITCHFIGDKFCYHSGMSGYVRVVCQDGVPRW